MSTSESSEFTLNETLIWEQGLRLFALTNLSKGNPFREEIAEQASRSLEELRRASSINSKSADLNV